MDIRPYTSGNLDAVTNLYERGYRGDIERRRRAFQWIHHHNPHSDPEGPYLLAWDGGRVAGYWGRMPVRLYVRGEPIPAVYSQEALVDPEVRGRGVASTLLREANQTPRFMISLWHNERVVSLLSKAGWTRVGAPPTLRRIYRLDRLVASRVRAGPLGVVARVLATPHRLLNVRRIEAPPDYVVEQVREFGPEFDELFAEATSRYPLIADRGAAVLHWKYGGIPYERFHTVAVRRAGRLKAYGVLRMQEGTGGIRKGTIVDLLGDASDLRAMDALAAYSDAFFREQRADLAVCIVAPLPLQQSLRRVGFRRVRPKEASSLWIRNQHLIPGTESAALEKMDDWYVTYGDSDSHMW